MIIPKIIKQKRYKVNVGTEETPIWDVYWYEVNNDKTVKMGGYLHSPSSGAIITVNVEFPIELAEVPDMVIIQPHVTNTSMVYEYAKVVDPSTTGFTFAHEGIAGNPNIGFYWTARGVVA